MPPKRDETEGEPKKNPGNDKNFEKVVDELRNVLAGLSNPKPEDISPVIPPFTNPAPTDDSFLRSKSSPILPPSDEPPEKLGEAAFRQAAGLSSQQPSDQEFWNGNVLGWPAGAAPAEETPEEAPPFSNPDEPSLSAPAAEAESPLPAPSLSDRLWLEGHVGPDELPQTFPPMPERIAPPPKPPVPVPPLASPVIEEFQLPPAPVPPGVPSSNDDEADVSSLIIEPFAGDNESLASNPLPTAEPDNTPPEPSRTVLPASLKIPIPGTLHQLPPTRKPKTPDSTLTEMEIHHAPAYGIACIYPEGREGDAQEFVKRLKEAMAGSKTSNKIIIEAVLVTPWSAAQMNSHALKKAASISGANLLYVLASRKDKDIFKDLSRQGHKDEIRARLVFIEQVAMRALYADLLADLLRSLDVKG